MELRAKTLLDVKTAFLMWGAQAVTLSILLLAVWLHDRSQRYFLLFSIGFALNGFGGISHTLRNVVSDSATIYIGNGLTLLSLAIWANGLRLFDGRKMVIWPMATPALWFIIGVFPIMYADFSLRLETYCITMALGHLFMASTLLSYRLSTPRYRLILAGLWISQSIVVLVFAAYSFVTNPQSLADIPFLGLIITLFIVCMVSTIVLLSKIIMDKNQLLLKQLSITDPLTGALNRRGLIEAANRLKQKTEKQKLIALMVFDLDHFKGINDTFGHQAGDAVLSSFAAMVTSVITKSGIDQQGLFARSGGEEFCALLAVADLRQAAGLAEQIRNMVATTPFVFEQGTVRLTTSIGVSALTADDFDFDAVMRQADHGLYKAKADGRNRTAIARGDSVYCLGPALEPGSPAAIDQDTDLQVAALRRLTQRQLHTEL
jgi:diguanylate cyclase (GGDEF)-like protein